MKGLVLAAAFTVAISGPAGGQTLDVRRVVTGHDDNGTATFVDDGPPSHLIGFEALPGLQIATLWATPADLSVPQTVGAAGVEDAAFLPAPGQTRLVALRLPTEAEIEAAIQAGSTPQTYAEEFALKIPDLAEAHDPAEPGMHRTNSVDYVIVLSGKVALELEGGARRRLDPGDIVVQTGTSHRWHNLGDEGAVLVAVMVGAARGDERE